MTFKQGQLKMDAMKSRRGGALIEFVLVLPILLLLVGGLVDFGILFYNKQVITNASREGARAGIVYETDSSTNEKVVIEESDIQAIVLNYCHNKLWNMGGNTIHINAADIDSMKYPDDLTVTVSINGYELLLAPLLNLFGGNFGNLNLSASTVMRLE